MPSSPSLPASAGRARPLRSRLVFIGGKALALAFACLWLGSPPTQPEAGLVCRLGRLSPGVVGSCPAPQQQPEQEAEPADVNKGLVYPNGDLPTLSCADARTITRQARMLRAVPAEPVVAARFARSAADWLDPHGFWSVAPDSPVAREIEKHAAELLAELEAAPQAGPCNGAIAVGASLARWVEDLRTVMIQARQIGAEQAFEPRRRWEVVSGTPFEDGTATRRSSDLARLIGHSLGVGRAAFGQEMDRHCQAAIERMAPKLSAQEWSEVLLAAAVRAYLPQVDPHGAWAPVDEESSIYDLSLEVFPPAQLWGDMTRTALGARIDRDALEPLHEGDIVIEIGGVSVSGLSIEQANQLALVGEDTREVTVLRENEKQPRSFRLSAPLPSDEPMAEPAVGLSHQLVDYGEGRVLVLQIPDVPDDLGDLVLSAIASEVEPPSGILLDLRGNGGGSTDGALTALGIFLPGAPLFPLRRRDGTIEVDRAPRVVDGDHWKGPVAALVDGDSASAAEMIAGALMAYRRGPVLGSRTYGKGCAQEYLDDESGRGVLRLTTLVFSLPDGSPLQQVGVTPDIALGLPSGIEREANLSQAPSTWRGPDVRDQALVAPVPWPEHGGRVGLSGDEGVYRALRALGASRAAKRNAP